MHDEAADRSRGFGARGLHGSLQLGSDQRRWLASQRGGGAEVWTGLGTGREEEEERGGKDRNGRHGHTVC